MNWIAIAAASAAAGLLGAMGLGGGGVLLLYLTFVGTSQLAAQGINLVFILPVGLLGLWFHRKNGLVDLRLALPMILGGILGVAAGSLAAGMLSEELLGRLFGGLILIIGLRELWSAWRIIQRQGWRLFPKK